MSDAIATRYVGEPWPCWIAWDPERELPVAYGWTEAEAKASFLEENLCHQQN